MTKTKKVRASGRFRAGYGKSVREKLAKLEEKQRVKQTCPFCERVAKRVSKGIWQCKKCNKKFASHAYYINE